MLEDAQYEYLVKFFDGGSLKRLKTQLSNAEKAIEGLKQEAKLANGEVTKLLNLQQLASRQGFSSNPKLDRAGVGLVRGGGLKAEEANARVQGEIARRNARISDQIVKLKEDAYRRLKRNYANLDRAQLDALVDIKRQKFIDKEITSKKEAQLKLEAAKLRAGLALERDLNNRDGRSTGRLRRELGEAQGDVATVEKQVAAFNKLESTQKRISAEQTKYNSALGRANILRGEGNNLEARREILNAKKAKAKILEIRQETLTTQELREQVNLNKSIERSKARIKQLASTTPADSLERRLQDGGAGLFKIQAQLLANYAAMGVALRALSFAGRFVVDLDKEFAQLQAITATTDESMGKLEKTVIRVSEGVKFTALEVAEAATIMGQAGFSVDQITSSIENITLLATAVGTDLKTAVDLVTSTISVFNLRSEEAGNIANVFTTAVNNSKLNLEKLTLGLQYAGNIANEQNITFSELTATLGAMANSGIRSGSTLGTGLRQILTALAAPSEKLQRRLEALGLSTDDVNVKLHGLTGVLRNLQEAGFTTTDALQVLEVRAGAAYAALTNNSDTIEELRRKFLLSSAAAEANAVQMEALANKGARLTSVFGTLAAKALDPLVEVAKIAIDTLSVFLSVLNKLGPVVPIITTALVAYTAAVIANRAAMLARNLAGKATIASLFGEAAAARAAGLGFKGLLVAMGPIGGGIAAITAAVGLAKVGIDYFTESVDELKSKVDESTGRLDTYTENIRSLDKEIEILSQRHFDAKDSMEEVNNIALELQLKFGDLGGSFDFTTGRVQALIPELERLRDTMLDIRNVELGVNIEESRKLQRAQVKRARKGLNGVVPYDPYAVGFGVGSLDSPFNANDRISRTAKEFLERDFNDEELLQFYQDIQRRRSRNTTLVRAIDSGTLDDEQRATTLGLVPELKRTGFGFRFNDNKTEEDDIADVRAILAQQNEVLGKFNDRFLPVLQTQNNIQSQERAIDQTAFEQTKEVKASRSRLISLDQELAKARAENDVTTPEGKEAVQVVVDKIREAVEDDKQNFEGREREFQASGLSQAGQALLSRAEASVKMTETQQREQNDLHRARQEAAQAEIDLIRRTIDAKDSELTIAQGKDEALRLYDEKIAEARKEEERQLDESNAKKEIREARLAAFDRKAVADRERLAQAFDNISLEKETKKRKISYESLELQLDKEIALEKKRVNQRSSVYEIQQAKERALALQSQKEIAAREDLRFRYRNDTESLGVEMEKLNVQLASDREAIALSFDSMHEEISVRQTPQLRNALTELTNAFDEARVAFNEKVQKLDDPVEDLEASRRAMDTEENRGRFSDSSRRRVDREIRDAKLQAMQEEIDLIKAERIVDLKAEQAALEARRVEIDAKIARAEAVLANYNGGDNSTSPEQAKQAAAELEQLKRQGLQTDEEIRKKGEEISQMLERIRELQREIGAVSGEAAPETLGWLDALKQGFQDYIDWLDEATIKSDEFADVAAGVMKDATSELGDAFFDIATGAKSVGEAFGDMAKSILKAILKILAEQAAIFAVKALLSVFGVPMTPSGGGGFGFKTGGVIGQGGIFIRRARGGTIPNVGISGRDYTPVLAEAGEFMMRKSAVDSIGKDKLYAMNAMGNRALEENRLTQVAIPENLGGNKEVNVYVVSPEEKPQLGPDDIIHVIGEDLVTGGKTKQLIKHVMMR